ncbi:murein L,D-transpeptidase catalytic domain-containing protein [Brevundimonas sp.]|uniref:murein L,D-transpeptidase catalytic domain-containing protein n=1 Tax=Brevundimonas sp. TaxID=1871086 RepID=UPI003BA9AF6E
MPSGSPTRRIPTCPRSAPTPPPGPTGGAQQGPNVLLDGLEYSNDRARERAIIIHGADYADPDFLAREGKLGRSYGCFLGRPHRPACLARTDGRRPAAVRGGVGFSERT